jgi:hypothetical protein
MRVWAVWCASAAVLLSTSLARADRCPVPAGGSPKLAAVDARERIDFLHRTVDDQARYARTWKWAWFGIGWATFASSAGQAIGWAAGSDKAREANVIDNLVVSGFSLVTPLSALLFSPRVESDAPVIDRLLRDTAGGAAGTCLVLARMEELVEKDAREEAFNSGPVMQVVSLLGLAGMFSIMAVQAALASDPDVQTAHWINAVVNTAGGLLLTEAQIFTTPTGAVHAYRRYLAGDLPRSPVALSIAPLAAGAGVTLRLSF